MRTLLCLMLLLVGSSLPVAWAGDSGYTFTVLPSPLVEGQPIQIRVQTDPGMCTPLPATLLVSSPSPNVVRYSIGSSDGCFPPNIPAEDRTYTVPSLPAGQYVFRFVVCGFTPWPPAPDGCSTLEDRSVAVFGLGATRFTVPSLSWGGILALAGALLLIGMRR